VDPYPVWLSEIMLQQTNVKTATPYFEKFLVRWPDVAALASAPLEDVLIMWAGLGYYSRARNLHACARLVARDHGGRFPDHEEGLLALPGIGPYSAAAIAAIAFGRRVMPVDGNIERVVARLFAIAEELPQAKSRIREHAARLLSGLPAGSCAGDCAQAMMDLGALICTPKRPQCGLCPLGQDCAANRAGQPETFPRKRPRGGGELRHGAAFVVTSGDRLLVQSRPQTGLLGGMTEVPGSQWRSGLTERAARREAPQLKAVRRWRRTPGVVTHIFSHFRLELVVYRAEVESFVRAPRGMRWAALSDLSSEALPGVMRKVIAHALAPPSRCGLRRAAHRSA